MCVRRLSYGKTVGSPEKLVIVTGGMRNCCNQAITLIDWPIRVNECNAMFRQLTVGDARPGSPATN